MAASSSQPRTFRTIDRHDPSLSIEETFPDLPCEGAGQIWNEVRQSESADFCDVIPQIAVNEETETSMMFSVCKIIAYFPSFPPGEELPRSGTGFLFNFNGRICVLTAAHCFRFYQPHIQTSAVDMTKCLVRCFDPLNHNCTDEFRVGAWACPPKYDRAAGSSRSGWDVAIGVLYRLADGITTALTSVEVPLVNNEFIIDPSFEFPDPEFSANPVFSDSLLVSVVGFRQSSGETASAEASRTMYLSSGSPYFLFKARYAPGCLLVYRNETQPGTSGGLVFINNRIVAVHSGKFLYPAADEVSGVFPKTLGNVGTLLRKPMTEWWPTVQTALLAADFRCRHISRSCLLA